MRSVAFFSKSINKIEKNYKIHDKEMLAVIRVLVLQTQVLRVEQVNKPIVATTRPVSNSSTSNKSQRWISSGEHELCNSQENLTGNHNSILLTIYINYL